MELESSNHSLTGRKRHPDSLKSERSAGATLVSRAPLIA